MNSYSNGFPFNATDIRQEIQRFESVHPSIYAIYDLLELIQDQNLQEQLRDHVICIEDSFVNSQEWTLSRAVSDLKLGILGTVQSGKSALVHRYLTGSYMQDESPEGGRFKKEIQADGQSFLLLIRDEGGMPDMQFTLWVDAVVFVFSLENEDSFKALYSYYAKMNQFRNTAEVPLILVGTQDAISESRPRQIDDGRARKLASDLGKRCSYYETCATYGLNVDRVFQDACVRMSQARLARSRPATPQHPISQIQAAAFVGTATIHNAVVAPSPAACFSAAPLGTPNGPAGVAGVGSSSSSNALARGLYAASPAQNAAPFGQSNMKDFQNLNCASCPEYGEGGCSSSCSDSECMSSRQPGQLLRVTVPDSTSSYQSAAEYCDYYNRLDSHPPPPPSPQARQQREASFRLANTPKQATSTVIIKSHSFHSPPIAAHHHLQQHHHTKHPRPLQQQSSSQQQTHLDSCIGTGGVFSESLPSASTQPLPATPGLKPSPSLQQQQQQQQQMPPQPSVRQSSLRLQQQPSSTVENESFLRDWRQQQLYQQEQEDAAVAAGLLGYFSPTAVSAATGPDAGFAAYQHISGDMYTQASAGLASRPTRDRSSFVQGDKTSDGKDLPTPSSTPTQTRKNRRKSNLFQKKGEEEKGKKEKQVGGIAGNVTTPGSAATSGNNAGAESGSLGQGRTIPVLQGQLYKKSTSGLNREWKKKYCTLTEDGRMTYHPTLHDYMEDSHGKDIELSRTTVKIPGMMRPTSNGLLKKEMNSYLSDLGVRSNANNAVSDLAKKRRHRRAKSGAKERSNMAAGGAASGVARADDGEDSDGYEFTVVSLDNRTWHFEAASHEERHGWVRGIEEAILRKLQTGQSGSALSRPELIAQAPQVAAIRAVFGNDACADCGKAGPEWASLNLGALVCIECSGVHRQLGTHLSRVRSLTLDDWPSNHVAVMKVIGNKLANSVWEARLASSGRRKAGVDTSREEKEAFIKAKYVSREFLPELPFKDSPVQQQLIDAIARTDTRQVILCLAVAGDAVNHPYSKHDPRAAIHIAAQLGAMVYLQLLLWYNADVTVVDHEGRNAFFYATAAKQTECADFLRAAGCPTPTPVSLQMQQAANSAAATLPRRRSKTALSINNAAAATGSNVATPEIGL